ncbi:MAG: hypothetical protein JJ992_10310, partial [Planctomycetes bacterium]|nr:hypothetical protein [Planctomycetota bacterium]
MDKSVKPVEENAGAPGTALLFDGRYETRDVLKNSRTTRTYIGRDRETGAPVVIKTIGGGHVPAGIQVRLELEADILRRIRHPLMTPLL